MKTDLQCLYKSNVCNNMALQNEAQPFIIIYQYFLSDKLFLHVLFIFLLHFNTWHVNEPILEL